MDNTVIFVLTQMASPTSTRILQKAASSTAATPETSSTPSGPSSSHPRRKTREEMRPWMKYLYPPHSNRQLSPKMKAQLKEEQTFYHQTKGLYWLFMSPWVKRYINRDYLWIENSRMQSLRARLMKQPDPEGILDDLKARIRAENPEETLSSASDMSESEDEGSDTSAYSEEEEVIVISSDEEDDKASSAPQQVAVGPTDPVAAQLPAEEPQPSTSGSTKSSYPVMRALLEEDHPSLEEGTPSYSRHSHTPMFKMLLDRCQKK